LVDLLVGLILFRVVDLGQQRGQDRKAGASDREEKARHLVVGVFFRLPANREQEAYIADG